MEKLKAFWNAFVTALNKVQENPQVKEQSIEDINNINLLAIASNKIANLVCTDATFELETDSTLAEPLTDIVEKLEKNRFDITQALLAHGECYVFPAVNDNGGLYLWTVPLPMVFVAEVQDDKVLDIYAILETATEKNKTFFLMRRHKLVGTDLVISYAVYNERGKPATYPKWDDLAGTETTYKDANHIGCGRYKNVTSSRGLSQLGVPLNFGCEQLEADFFDTLKKIQKEFDNTETRIFADTSVAKKTVTTYKDSQGNNKEHVTFDVPKNIFLINKRAGESGNLIDIFNPQIRYSEYYSRLINTLELYEMQIGASKGILTPNSTTGSATATEVRRANADTLSLVSRIRDVIDNGNKDTLTAFNLLLNVPSDLWSYTSDWFDPFQDPAEQWAQLKDGINMGLIAKERGTQWLYPSMAPEEAAQEVQSAMSSSGFDMALENTLTE